MGVGQFRCFVARRDPLSRRMSAFQWLSIVTLLLTLLLTPLALSLDEQYPPYRYRPEKLAKLARRQHSPAKPSVVEGLSDAPLVRPELRQLQQDEDLWTLFLLGVSWMQYVNQTDPASWYGIAGSWPSDPIWMASAPASVQRLIRSLRDTLCAFSRMGSSSSLAGK